jgi:predicted kinase
MAEAVILVGLQGSGKTTYFCKHFADTHAHISRDVQKTAGQEAALMQACLCAGRCFALDNTNATKSVRARYIRQAKAAGFRVICYFFDTPVRTAIGRNNHRKDKKPIPVPAILRSAKFLEAPALEEGFDEIHVVKPERDSEHRSG